MQDHQAPAELTQSDEAPLWERLRSVDVEESRQAREDLVLRHLWLAKAVAARVLQERSFTADLDLRDLVQLATVGLIESVDRYDPSMGVPFSAYARKRVQGAVLNGLEQSSEYRAQNSWLHRMGKERAESITSANSSEGDSLLRLAEVTVGLAIGFMLEDSGMYVSSPDRIDTPYDVNELAVLQGQLRLVVTELPESQRKVVELHYFKELSFSEIGAVLRLTKARISQIHGKALLEIRRRLKLVGQIDERG
ncbi:sigma-70 family RNA polymerase sigma factor [Solimonas sp. SE-A11]|uniref:sigma-70 family RNA polymerase sigma factor n=1 Tax=Solimonas sp. SE-A11 TaxID=3054954 RepID=UPI00259C7735|nr:sigma-70 family RNA polymerase sigma factor [Solimonas sp. SE-A11]MDM4772924.1 sigma-70 family RNA polymerase sigma factor [Solimonas sp. SE-A11]